MAETATAENSTPATEGELHAHEVTDAAAHEAISQTEDEDYKWLTDRLDDLRTKQAAMETAFQSRLSALEALLQANQDQARTLIEAQTLMIETLTSNLTALSESALLRSTQTLSENSSQAEAQTSTTETTTEVEPATVRTPAAESADSTSAEPTKKRRRL